MTYYRLMRERRGPQIMRLGKSGDAVRISPEADAEFTRRMVAEAATESA
jgi:hypothetical protein